MGGGADMPEGHVVIQRDLNRLESQADQNHTMFNKAECKILHLRRNHTHQCRLGTAHLDSSSVEKDLEVLVSPGSPACLEDRKVNDILSCINKNITMKQEELTLTFIQH